MAWNLDDLQESLLIGSTLVEGSTLTEDEARAVLAGRTLVGHPVHEIRELVSYRAAVEWLMRELAKDPHLSMDLLLGFHRILMQGLSDEAGRFKTRSSFTYLSDGARHDYLAPAEVEPAMRDWLACFNGPAGDDPVEGAARLYLRSQQIHPFEDGNGRIGRVAVAYWLHWKASLSFTFRAKDRLEHLEALEHADRGDMRPLVRFFRARCAPEPSP